MCDRLLIGRPLCCAISGPLPIIDGLLSQSGLSVMSSKNFGLDLADIRKLPLKDACYARMQVVSLYAEERAIGHVLHQCVLEQIVGMRRHALPKQQTSLNETVQRQFQLRRGLARHRSQQGMRKLAPDRRSDLRHLLGRAEPVISDACKLAGTAWSRDGTVAAVRRAAPSFSASSTALVISSTNRGMPSVRSTISAITSAGSTLFSTSRAMIAAVSRSPSRFSVRLVTYDRPTQGALNLGRKVTMSSTGRVAIRSTARPRTSRLVGSIQCASSKIISTGFWRASPASCDISASSVLCLRCSGVKSSAAYRPSFRSDSISAKSAASWAEVEVCASTESSLSSFACGLSSCASPAARSIWPIIE